jgi:PST family polysaccharide transporter
MKELLHSSGVLMLRQVLTAGVSVVRTKVVAVVLGPAGMGVLAQANQLRLLLDRVVNLGIGAGVSKYAAQYHAGGERDRLERFIGSVTALLLVSGTAVFVLAALFAPRLAAWVFDSPDRWLYVLLVAVALPLSAQVALAGFLLRGTLRFRAMAVSGVLSALAGLVVTVPLVLLFGLDGAVVSITLTALLGMAVHFVVLRRALLRPLGLHPSPRRPGMGMVLDLSRFGLVTVVGQGSRALGELIIRSSVISGLGEAANGLYQVAWSASDQFFALIVGALFAYALPKLSTTADDREGSRTVYNQVMRVYLVGSIPLAVAALVTARFWIPLLFSAEFLSADTILPWQFAAQMVVGFRTLTNAGLLAREHFRPLITLALTQTVLQVAGYYLLVGDMGIDAVPAALLVSQLVTAPPAYLVLARREGLTLSPKLVRLCATSAVLIAVWLAATDLLQPTLAATVTVGLLALWTAVNVHRRDLTDLWKILTGRGEEG